MATVMALSEFGTRRAAPLGPAAADVAAMDGAATHPLYAVALASAAWHLHQRDGNAAGARTLATAAVEAAGPEASVARGRALSALCGITAVNGDVEGAMPLTHQLLADAEFLDNRW